MTGGYYLHENGCLIRKNFLDIVSLSESNLVKTWWHDGDIGVLSPTTFVNFLKEAKSCGANDEEIFRLAKHNKLEKYISDWQDVVGVEE